MEHTLKTPFSDRVRLLIAAGTVLAALGLFVALYYDGPSTINVGDGWVFDASSSALVSQYDYMHGNSLPRRFIGIGYYSKYVRSLNGDLRDLKDLSGIMNLAAVFVLLLNATVLVMAVMVFVPKRKLLMAAAICYVVPMCLLIVYLVLAGGGFYIGGLDCILACICLISALRMLRKKDRL